MAFYAVEFGGTWSEYDLETYTVFGFDTNEQRQHWLADGPRMDKNRTRVYANDPVVRRSKMTYDGSHEGIEAMAYRALEKARLQGVAHRPTAHISLYRLQEQYETMNWVVTAARHSWQQHIERSEAEFDPYETERARGQYVAARERLDGFVQGCVAIGLSYEQITGEG